MVSDQYRMHRLRSGDEWVLGTLAKGNARFGDGSEAEWQAPLGSDEASQFVSDPHTVCIVAIDMATNHIAGFIYGGVLSRRHTRLHHMCLYEVGVDLDHRQTGVGMLLMQAFAGEARKLGIDRGFVITNEANHAAVALYESYGALRGDGNDRLFGLSF
ncbi:GNAT family N-acetyltransferase [Aquihabitans sp. G128]|uniref:GNAT family N-acetyltransferase n=1 Tax=Aquihabitans sp. G128 TaxID=2849779 RepID=UPI001C2125E2|nr:GNAT family N-acetyltransferase [Aquihabitans sp. G128]QXC62990.1 GNAT family N-acetyltransferase [Aquihabitans sp. G128]